MSVYHKKEVGRRIRSLREEKGWTRSNLAEQLDISDRYSSSIELGQKGLSIKTLSRVSEILDATTDYILTGIDMYKDRPEVFDKAVYWLDRCPPEKLPYLEEIVLEYLLSLDENQTVRVRRKKKMGNRRIAGQGNGLKS